MIQITFMRGRILICGWRCLSKVNKFHNVPYLNLVCSINDQLQYTRKYDFQWDSCKHPGQQCLSWMPFVHRLKFYTSRLYLTDAAALGLRQRLSHVCEFHHVSYLHLIYIKGSKIGNEHEKSIDQFIVIYFCAEKINITNSLRPSNICIHNLGILKSL